MLPDAAIIFPERLHKKPFACLPTALRPSGPVQQRIFHQAELTTLSVLRYSSGHRKGRLKIVCIQTSTGGVSSSRESVRSMTSVGTRNCHKKDSIPTRLPYLHHLAESLRIPAFPPRLT